MDICRINTHTASINDSTVAVATYYAAPLVVFGRLEVVPLLSPTF